MARESRDTNQQVILATGGFDRQIKFWESTGTISKTVKVQDSQVNCIQVSDNKKFLAAGCNPHIYIFEDKVSKATEDVAPKLTLEGHTANVTAIGFHKDCK